MSNSDSDPEYSKFEMSEDANPNSSKSIDSAAESKSDGIPLSGSVHNFKSLIGPSFQEREQPTEDKSNAMKMIASTKLIILFGNF